MLVTHDSDELDVLDAFSAGLDQLQKASDTTYAAEARALGRGGWLELARAANLGDDFALLTACAERAGLRARPLGFPLLETWVALRLLDLVGGQDDLLDRVGSGEELIALATDPLCGAQAGAEQDSWGPVVAADGAQWILLPRPVGPDAFEVHLVSRDELTLTGRVSMDPSLVVSTVATDATSERTRIGELSREALLTLGAEYLVLQSAELCGAARWLFERAVDHLRVREQFGQPLSRFQALQHAAADDAATLLSSRALHSYAGWAVGTRHPDHLQLARLAKGFVGENAVAVAGHAIQWHGGQGFTAEAGLHHGTQRIMFRAVTGLHCREALRTVGAAVIDRQRLVRASLPEELLPEDGRS